MDLNMFRVFSWILALCCLGITPFLATGEQAVTNALICLFAAFTTLRALVWFTEKNPKRWKYPEVLKVEDFSAKILMVNFLATAILMASFFVDSMKEYSNYLVTVHLLLMGLFAITSIYVDIKQNKHEELENTQIFTR